MVDEEKGLSECCCVVLMVNAQYGLLL